jgi:hypothetical protein
VRTRIFTKVQPLFFAKGISKLGEKKAQVVQIYSSYEEAVKAAQTMLHMSYTKVSAGRLEDF